MQLFIAGCNKILRIKAPRFCTTRCHHSFSFFYLLARGLLKHHIMKIAVTTFKGRIAPRFDTSETLLVITAENQQVVSAREIHIEASGVEQRIRALYEIKADCLVCNGIGGRDEALVSHAGIRVISGVMGETTVMVQHLVKNGGRLCKIGRHGSGLCQKTQRTDVPERRGRQHGNKQRKGGRHAKL
ncbi:MAG: hypothetical protein HQM16_17490 [Deltaproteobacteria bacterium]|nr:hypothetical protein [Deltaproteobacteria bacterium]